MHLTLIDINPSLTHAWQAAFCDAPEVEVVCGSLLCLSADAWVTPTNALGRMDGGLDAVMKRYFGAAVEKRVQRQIGVGFGGRLPVGCATCVPTAGLHAPPGGPQPSFLISTPTMTASAQDVSGTWNVAWSFAAALQAAHFQNRYDPDSVRSLAVPGLGAATGRVPAAACAAQMWTAYQLFRDGEVLFDDFASMHAALLERLSQADPRPPRTTRKRGVLGILPSRDSVSVRFS